MEEEIGSASDNKLLDFVRSNILILGLLSLGLILIIVGFAQMMGESATEIKFEEGNSVDTAESDSNVEIKVDVDGAVLKPGLYSLNSDSRLSDAIQAAGGLTSEADRKQVNLAAKIADGQKIYVPVMGEEVPPDLNTSVLGSNVGSSGSISINSATQSSLEELPGIGPVTAVKIIDGRPYSTLEELRSKGVVGEKTYEKIVDLIAL